MDLPIIHLQEEKNEIQNYLHAILREFKMQHPGYQDFISSVLPRHSKDANHDYVSPGCLKVKMYIEDNFKQELTLKNAKEKTRGHA